MVARVVVFVLICAVTESRSLARNVSPFCQLDFRVMKSPLYSLDIEDEEVGVGLSALTVYQGRNRNDQNGFHLDVPLRFFYN